MPGSPDRPGPPAVSILLPTYNRAAFLPEAFESIRGQTFSDWELVVVDDGSTDDTPAVVERLTHRLDRPVRYVRQTNQGPYGARNTALDHARGRYVAFFDSDDQWLPHHLSDCAAALDAHPEVDWVFSACRRVEHGTGRVLRENTFYHADGSPWPFLRLKAKVDGRLRILDDPRALACHLTAGLNCGLQTSVIRRAVFDGYRFQTRFRNEAEDGMTVVHALATGLRMAYFDAVHVTYNVHPENSSATASQGAEKQIAVLTAEARGFEELVDRGIRLSPAERRALRRRLYGLYFWQLGYALLWSNGRRREALDMLRRGLGLWPWELRAWKTYLYLRVRSALSPVAVS